MKKILILTTLIYAEIIGDSIWNCKRLTTFRLTFPRYILAELNTHRVFSRNSASSRAIPFKKMLKSVKENPYVPDVWIKDHKGMQGKEILQDRDKINAIKQWKKALDYATDSAEELYNLGVSKQICNRLLEPFMWHTVILSGTDWNNFFSQRCSVKTDRVAPENVTHYEKIFLESDGQAEINMQILADEIKEKLESTVPKETKFHIPFEKDIQVEDKKGALTMLISSSMCARVSYTTFDGYIENDIVKNLELCERLIKNGHMSPFEHIGIATDNENIMANFTGWGQFRHYIEFNKQTVLNDILALKEIYGTTP